MSWFAVLMISIQAISLIWIIAGLIVKHDIDNRFSDREYADLTLLGRALILPWTLLPIAERAIGKLIWKGDSQ